MGYENKNKKFQHIPQINRQSAAVLMRTGSGPRLVLLAGPVKGRYFPFAGHDDSTGFSVGSHKSADFWLSGESGFDNHARIEYLEGSWHISTEHQQAFVVVNGEPVMMAVLEHGDYVQIGVHQMVFLTNENDSENLTRRFRNVFRFGWGRQGSGTRS